MPFWDQTRALIQTYKEVPPVSGRYVSVKIKDKQKKAKGWLYNFGEQNNYKFKLLLQSLLSYLTGQLSANNDSILFCSDLLFICKRKMKQKGGKYILNSITLFFLFGCRQGSIHLKTFTNLHAGRGYYSLNLAFHSHLRKQTKFGY